MIAPVVSSISTDEQRAVAERRPAPSPDFARELARVGPRLVEPTKTPLGGEQAAAALETAWGEVTGESASPETLAVLCAHWAHETGHGEAMLNFNFAGIKGTGPTGLGAAYRTREGWGATEVRVVDTFRAYETPEAGARDYVSLLVRRYPEAVEAARAGDPEGFVRALKQRGYFTGNEEAYVRNVGTLSRQALAYGFDAMGRGGPVELPVYVPSEAGASFPHFGSGRAVPFEAMSMDLGLARIDGAALHDAVTRATLRLAGDSDDDAERRGSRT